MTDMRDHEEFMCGAFQPVGLTDQAGQLLPYRCTQPAGHSGPHIAEVEGETVASWGRLW